MAVTAQTFYRGAATTTLSTVLYTGPTTGTFIVTNIVVANTSATQATFTLSIAGTVLFSAVAIPGNSTLLIDTKQVTVSSGSALTITGGASATTVNLSITGVTL